MSGSTFNIGQKNDVVVVEDLQMVYRIAKLEVPALRGVEVAVKEGEFVEKSGAPTLKLIGNIKSSTKVVKTKTKIEKEDLIKQYPYSWTEMVKEVKKKIPEAKNHAINKIIRKGLSTRRSTNRVDVSKINSPSIIDLDAAAPTYPIITSR